jgi:TolA-binding protein
MGVANLAAGNEAEALPFLQNTLQYPQSVFLPDAYYYLGLLHLKQKKLKQAKEAFQKSNSTKGKAILLELDDKK